MDCGRPLMFDRRFSEMRGKRFVVMSWELVNIKICEKRPESLGRKDMPRAETLGDRAF